MGAAREPIIVILIVTIITIIITVGCSNTM